MQETPPIKLKSPRAIRQPENKNRNGRKKKRRYQLRHRKRLIKDLNSPTSPDSKIEPSKEFQPLTQEGTKDLENCNFLTIGNSKVNACTANPRRVTLILMHEELQKRETQQGGDHQTTTPPLCGGWTWLLPAKWLHPNRIRRKTFSSAEQEVGKGVPANLL